MRFRSGSFEFSRQVGAVLLGPAGKARGCVWTPESERAYAHVGARPTRAQADREDVLRCDMPKRILALTLLFFALTATAAELRGNPAGRHMPQAAEVAKLYDLYLKNELSPDERYYLAVEL